MLRWAGLIILGWLSLAATPVAATSFAPGSLLIPIQVPGGAGAIASVDPVSGNRTVVSGHSDASTLVGAGPTWDGGVWTALLGDGRLLVSTGGAGSMFAVDPATGDREVVFSIGDHPQFANEWLGELAVDAAGDVWVSTLLIGAQSKLLRLDPVSFTPTLVAENLGARLTLGPNGNPITVGMGFDGADPETLLRYDVGSDTTSILSGVFNGAGPNFEGPIQAMVGTSESDSIYLLDSAGALMRVSSASGDRELVSWCTPFANIGTGPCLTESTLGLGYEGGSSVYAYHGDRPLAVVAIDTTTGNRSVVSSLLDGSGPWDSGVPGNITLVPVPEPSTALLFGMGCLGLGASRKTRRSVRGGNGGL